MVTLLVPDWVTPSPDARQAASAVFASLVEAHGFIEARVLRGSQLANYRLQPTPESGKSRWPVRLGLIVEPGHVLKATSPRVTRPSLFRVRV